MPTTLNKEAKPCRDVGLTRCAHYFSFLFCLQTNYQTTHMGRAQPHPVHLWRIWLQMGGMSSWFHSCLLSTCLDANEVAASHPNSFFHNHHNLSKRWWQVPQRIDGLSCLSPKKGMLLCLLSGIFRLTNYSTAENTCRVRKHTHRGCFHIRHLSHEAASADERWAWKYTPVMCFRVRRSFLHLWYTPNTQPHPCGCGFVFSVFLIRSNTCWAQKHITGVFLWSYGSNSEQTQKDTLVGVFLCSASSLCLIHMERHPRWCDSVTRVWQLSSTSNTCPKDTKHGNVLHFVFGVFPPPFLYS